MNPQFAPRSFDAFCAGLVSDRLRAVAQHWATAKADRRMPAWRDIDPIAIAPHLPIVWSWKYDTCSDRFVGRLAGEEIIELAGRSFRGVPLEDFFTGRQSESVINRYVRVMSGPCLMHQRGIVFAHLGRHGLGEKLIMPVSEDGTRVDGVLGAAVYWPWSTTGSERALYLEGTAEKLVFLPLD
jgi:hypothetical protein